MNSYIFDSGPIIILVQHYYQKRFPSLWEKISVVLSEKRFFSVKEVFHELEGKEDDVLEWAKRNKSIFLAPTEEESLFIMEIFKIPHFQTLIGERQRLKGLPAADPFLIASAKVNNATLVTTEKEKANSAKIPNVCKHFGVDCINLEEFMEREGWKF
ncbi:MAG: PIN domain-containing protein [Candidatus Peregrinibacteria bacterium]